jgi:prepilin peptidase CpaA
VLFVADWALAAWAATAAGLDLRWRRVPNALLLALLIPAVLVLGWTGRGLLEASSLQSLAGALAAVLLLPGYALGRLGAGDVKLVACLGFVLGGWAALEMLLVGAALLGLASAVALMRQGSRRLPAAPAFALAFALQLVFGPQLV